MQGCVVIERLYVGRFLAEAIYLAWTPACRSHWCSPWSWINKPNPSRGVFLKALFTANSRSSPVDAIESLTPWSNAGPTPLKAAWVAHRHSARCSYVFRISPTRTLVTHVPMQLMRSDVFMVYFGPSLEGRIKSYGLQRSPSTSCISPKNSQVWKKDSSSSVGVG